jgi:hypothetical protein
MLTNVVPFMVVFLSVVDEFWGTCVHAAALFFSAIIEESSKKAGLYLRNTDGITAIWQ